MKLLIVEEIKKSSKSLEKLLKLNNYTVDRVDSGKEAVDYLLVDDYDAAILEEDMQDLDGISVIKHLRNSNIDIPIILLSFNPDIENIVFALDAGADDFLVKPFDERELLARLRTVTRRQTRYTPNELNVGNIKLNKKTFELSNEVESIVLSNKEFQIIEMLFRNPTSVISTEEFLTKIWGYQSEAEINVVWVNISYLRRKLKKLDANINIKSNRNTGYTLKLIEN